MSLSAVEDRIERLERSLVGEEVEGAEGSEVYGRTAQLAKDLGAIEQLQLEGLTQKCNKENVIFVLQCSPTHVLMALCIVRLCFEGSVE